MLNVRGTVEMRVEVAPRSDYGRVVPTVEVVAGGVRFVDGCELDATVDLTVADGTASAEFTVSDGESVTFVLETTDTGADDLTPEDGAGLLDATMAFWRRWLAQSTYTGPTSSSWTSTARSSTRSTRSTSTARGSTAPRARSRSARSGTSRP
ncbi:hypothetical protein [Pseudonocardia xishanensis]|uniref:hypothetical protein n=1 Tax=Pseudonocardia xishanensis TaxID=630995 RepID=UPI0031E69B08